MKAKTKIGFLATALMVGSVAVPAMAQTAPDQTPPANNGGGGNGGGGAGGQNRRGNFDPAQFRQRMMDNLKQQLGSSDDDFAALQPKLEQVMTTKILDMTEKDRPKIG